MNRKEEILRMDDPVIYSHIRFGKKLLLEEEKRMRDLHRKSLILNACYPGLTFTPPSLVRMVFAEYAEKGEQDG